MLIIEGTDLVGKTTLCHALVTRLQEEYRLPAVYRHFTRLPSCWDYYHDYLPHMHRSAVMDRFHISELAYTRARGEPRRIDQFMLDALDAHLTLMGGFTVVFTADEKRLERAFAEKNRDEMYGVSTILRANEAFMYQVGMISMPNDVDMSLTRKVDIHIHLGARDPWPSSNPDLVSSIVSRYMDRLDRIAGIVARRSLPRSLTSLATCRD